MGSGGVQERTVPVEAIHDYRSGAIRVGDWVAYTEPVTPELSRKREDRDGETRLMTRPSPLKYSRVESMTRNPYDYGFAEAKRLFKYLTGSEP